MTSLVLRTPALGDLTAALGDCRHSAVWLPALLSFALVSIGANLITSAFAVATNTYGLVLARRLAQPETQG